MKTLWFALLVSGSAACALARPIPLVPTRLDVPAPYQPLAATVEGDDIFAIAHAASDLAVLQFHRLSNGEWEYARTLLLDPGGFDGRGIEDIDIDGDVLAVLLSPERVAIFERDGGAWMRGTLAATEDYSSSTTIAVSQGHLLVGVRPCSLWSMVIGKDAAGTWRQTGRLRGSELRDCGFDPVHPAGALEGNDVVKFEGDSYDWHENEQSQIWWYRNSGELDWPRFAAIPSPPTRPAEIVGQHSLALGRGYVFALGSQGPVVYTLVADGRILPAPRDHLQSLDDAMAEKRRDVIADQDLVAVGLDQGRMGEVVHVWHRNRTENYDTFDDVAIAHVRDDQHINKFDLSDRSLVVSSIDDADPLTRGDLWVFEIPQTFSTPDPRQQDFQDNDSSQWLPIGASQLAVVRSGHSRVLRQSNLASNTGALLADTDWSNQSVQADIRVSEFPASDGFVALASRYRDFNDYYYVSLRHGDRLALRKKVGGVVTELAAMDFPVTPGRTYRVRLDTRADDLYAYVDNSVMLHARDHSLTRGAAGFRGYHASYDIDNVLVSPLSSTLYRRDVGEKQQRRPWSFDAGEWSFPDQDTVRQSAWHSAFALIGRTTDDEIVESRARVDAFNPASTAAWAGVLARFTDRSDYYLLALRSNGAVQLRKVVHGTTTLLAGRVMTVAPGTSHLLRFDVTGDRLRGYVDGVLQVEATDDALRRGRTGLATYQTKASFASYLAYQP